MINRRKEAVLNFNKALWILRAETPDTERGMSTLLMAIETSLATVFALYEAGVTQEAFFAQLERTAMEIFEPEAKA